MVFLIIISFLGYCMLLVASNYCTSGKSPIFTICFMGITIYLFSLVGLLLPIVYVVYIGGLFSIPLAIFLKRKANIISFLKSFFSPSIFLFIISIIILYIFSKPVHVYSLDEFTHWALYTKYLLIYDKLPSNADIVPFFYLPPFASIIQYYFARLLGSSEGMFYWAQNVFLISTITCITSNTKWENPFKSIVLFLLCGVLYVKYNEFIFFNLYSDALMAFVAFSAFGCYINSDKKYLDVLKIIPIIFVIPLIRESAPSFAYFSTVLILVDQIARHGLKIKTNSLKEWIKNNKHILASLCLIIVVSLSLFIWNTYVKSMDFGGIYKVYTRGNSRNFMDTAKYITNYFDEIGSSLVGSYAKEYRIFSSIPMIYMMALTLSMLTLLILHHNKMNIEYRSLKTFIITLGLIVITYILGLLYIYLFRFGKEEADRFASMSRYLSSIAMFIMLTTIAYLSDIEKTVDSSIVKKIITYSLVFLLLLNIISTSAQRLNILKGRVMGYVDMRKNIHDVTYDIDEMFNEDNKIYIIYQNETHPIVIHASRYELMADINSSAFYLGPNGTNLSVDEFRYTLINEGYEYVLLENTDKTFWETYGELFSSIDDGHKLYSVDGENEFLLNAIK